MLSFITGWTWLVGNWTITLSVNYGWCRASVKGLRPKANMTAGFASLIAACVSLYKPDIVFEPYQLLLIFYGLCILTFFICAFGNRFLPSVDTICAAFTLLAIFITLICLSVKADVGRNSPADTLGYYDPTLSGWGDFSFLIGLLPSAYT